MFNHSSATVKLRQVIEALYACFLTSEMEIIIATHGASLVVQWLRVQLPVQETWVCSLARKDPTCHKATKPVDHHYWSRGPLETELQQEQPPREALAPQLFTAGEQQRRPSTAKNK